jgi:hypothetical protein
MKREMRQSLILFYYNYKGCQHDIPTFYSAASPQMSIA